MAMYSKSRFINVFSGTWAGYNIITLRCIIPLTRPIGGIDSGFIILPVQFHQICMW